jgi:hypothetical protein
MICTHIDVKWGERNGNTIWDSYRVGDVPFVNSIATPFLKKKISSIEILTLPYTVAANIYYADGSLQYIEDVKRYYYIDNESSAQRESPKDL